MMRNKKGVLGSAIVMIISIIAIVIILLIFAFGSEVVKRGDKAATGVSIMDEKSVGINDVFVYMSGFKLLGDARYFVEGGKPLDEVLAKYESGVVKIIDESKREVDDDDVPFDEDFSNFGR